MQSLRRQALTPLHSVQGPSMGTDLVPLDFTYRLTQYNLSNFDVSAQTQYTEFIYSLAPGVTTVYRWWSSVFLNPNLPLSFQ